MAAGVRVDFVGRLEHAADDWAAAMRGTGIAWLRDVPLVEHSSNNASAGFDVSHASSADPQGARRTMQELLAARPALRARLCDVLYVDYVVLGYDPAACYGFSAQHAS